MKNISIITLFLSLLLAACGGDSFIGGQHQENLKRLDKIHGYCDNPARTDMAKKGIAYNICKDHERALGPDGEMSEKFTLGESLNDLLDRDSGGKMVLAQTINKELWNGSLKVLSNYSIKNADSNGGYIETDWIYDSNDNLQRCLIKIQITSTELISTGISTNFLCQIKKNDIWVSDNIEYVQESKDLNLTILSNTKLFN